MSSLLAMLTSADSLTRVVSTALLLPGVGSGSSAATLVVLVIVPPASAVTVMVIDAVAPLLMVPKLHGNAPQPPCDEVMLVMVTLAPENVS